MTPEDKGGAVHMAATALAHARLRQWEEAGAQVRALQERYGFEGVQVLMIGLADTVLYYQGGPAEPGGLVAPMWLSVDGKVARADEVRPAVRWAGRFIAARAADDLDGCNDLVAACTGDAEFSDNVCALIEVAACTLNTLAGVRR